MVVNPRSRLSSIGFFFSFLRTTVTLRYKVPRNGGVARVLNDRNLEGGGM